jgi:hypothetical protein
MLHGDAWAGSRVSGETGVVFREVIKVDLLMVGLSVKE